MCILNNTWDNRSPLIMSQGMEEALLKQRLEFLESEIDEYKKREVNLRELNESLMTAVSTASSSLPLQVPFN